MDSKDNVNEIKNETIETKIAEFKNLKLQNHEYRSIRIFNDRVSEKNYYKSVLLLGKFCFNFFIKRTKGGFFSNGKITKIYLIHKGREYQETNLEGKDFDEVFISMLNQICNDDIELYQQIQNTRKIEKFPISEEKIKIQKYEFWTDQDIEIVLSNNNYYFTVLLLGRFSFKLFTVKDKGKNFISVSWKGKTYRREGNNSIDDMLQFFEFIINKIITTDENFAESIRYARYN